MLHSAQDCRCFTWSCACLDLQVTGFVLFNDQLLFIVWFNLLQYSTRLSFTSSKKRIQTVLLHLHLKGNIWDSFRRLWFFSSTLILPFIPSMFKCYGNIIIVPISPLFWVYSSQFYCLDNLYWLSNPTWIKKLATRIFPHLAQ